MDTGWPPLKKCVQYECGMLRQYLQKFDWEDDEGDETNYEKAYDSSDDEVNDPPRYIYRFKPSSLRKFLKQVRESRGYYVDVDIKDLPRFANTPFMICSMNMNSTGKVYKHVDTLKVVYALRHSIYLLTFTAKVVAPRFTKRKKKNNEVAGKKKEVEDDGDAETFLATVYAPGCDAENYEVEECFLKPQGPAPWIYIDPFAC